MWQIWLALLPMLITVAQTEGSSNENASELDSNTFWSNILEDEKPMIPRRTPSSNRIANRSPVALSKLSEGSERESRVIKLIQLSAPSTGMTPTETLISTAIQFLPQITNSLTTIANDLEQFNEFRTNLAAMNAADGGTQDVVDALAGGDTGGGGGGLLNLGILRNQMINLRRQLLEMQRRETNVDPPSKILE